MLTLAAPAKVNLILSVSAPLSPGDPRAGFHEIASWFVPLTIADEVTIRPVEAGMSSTFSIGWAADAPRPTPIDWPIDNDLALRAHRLLEQTIGRPLPAHIDIRKRIPVGGGLGGGSSDAAAVLKGLSTLYSLALSDLTPLAMQLGSDVAYFCQGDPPPHAVVAGLGELVTEVPAVESEIILIIPPFGCSTGSVYRAYDTLLTERAAAEPTRRAAIANTDLLEKRRRKVMHAIDRGGTIPSELLFNDLTPAAFRIEPRLGRLATALANTLRAPIHMTGSGSTLFVMPRPGKAEPMAVRARSIADAIEPGSAVIQTGTLAGSPPRM